MCAHSPDSIAEVGLLHPVVVTPEGRLIAGQRRLEACRQLGWTEVPGDGRGSLSSRPRRSTRKLYAQRSAAERDRCVETRHRAAWSAARPASAKGSRADLPHPATATECQGGFPGDARDKIARYLGVGKTTIDRAEAVVEAAEEEPDEYGHLVEQMDRSGKVAGAYRRLEVLKQARQLEAAAPEFPTGPFQVIVADPPWRYESGNDLPYPTMAIEDIKAMPVQSHRRG